MKIKFTLLAALGAALLSILPTGVFAAANVKDYGAYGDGSHDDTGAINAAINADNAVYFPPGRYWYQSASRMQLPGIKSYRLYGDGAGNSIIEFHRSGGSANGILMTSTQANPRTLTVEGLTLRAMDSGCGDAINAQFGDVSAEGAWKTRCLTVRNVQIQGTDRTGYPSGYWNFGIYMWQATNSVIEDVQMENYFQYGTGIYWGSASTYGTTQLFVHNVSMLYWAKAVKTEGHVEGFNMSSFELTGVGTYNTFAMDLEGAISGGSHPPFFNLTNGHFNFIGGGVHFHNLSSVKVANVNFAHVGYGVGSGGQGSGTHVYLDDVWGGIVSNCDFAGPGPSIPYENGVYSEYTSQDVLVTGCSFGMYPNSGGSALVAINGVHRVKWLDNNFSWAINRYDNYAGSNTFIRDIP